VREDERTATLRLEGDLDIYRRDEIQSRLPAPGSVDRVIIDCSAATSIDSTILTMLMRYRRSFASAGGDPVNIVVIVAPSLRRIFEIAGLTRMLTIVSAPGRPTAAPESAAPENAKDTEAT
jgi:anti-anti-sigma factor